MTFVAKVTREKIMPSFWEESGDTEAQHVIRVARFLHHFACSISILEKACNMHKSALVHE